MSGRRKCERADDAVVAKILKLRSQGLSYQIISERVGLSRGYVEQIALKAIKK